MQRFYPQPGFFVYFPDCAFFRAFTFLELAADANPFAMVFILSVVGC